MPCRTHFPSALATVMVAWAGVWLLSSAATALAQGTDPEPAIRWQHELSGAAAVQIDVPTGWEVIEPLQEGAVTRFAPLDGTPCDVRVGFHLATGASPPVASAEALRGLVEREASDFLDQAVESRYTLRELRGPEAAGYYFTLRDRSPRRKEAVFLSRGALLVRNAVVRFSIETPKPDLPAIRQALKMLAGSRFLALGPSTAPDSRGTPAASTSSAAHSEPGLDE